VTFRPLTSSVTLQARFDGSKSPRRCRHTRYSSAGLGRPRWFAYFGLTCLARTALRPSRKGRTFYDPRRLPSYRSPASVAHRRGISASPTWHLAMPDRIEPWTRTFDGAERDSHTGSLECMLVHALLWSLPPAGFPRESSTPPEAGLLFRSHYPPCQWQGSSPRASSSCLQSALRLAAENERDAYDRLLLPTS